ncbi:MAG: hypothetical protein V1907_00075 [Candidatus Kerfeldbacteria bacterium]
MKKQHAYLIIGFVVIIVIFGGWYIFRLHKCEKQITYIPPREARDAGNGFRGLKYSVDGGDYYLFHFKEYKTSDDATRACIW